MKLNLVSQPNKASKLSLTTRASNLETKNVENEDLLYMLSQIKSRTQSEAPSSDGSLQKPSDFEDLAAFKLAKQCEEYSTLLIYEKQLDLQLIEQDKIKNNLQNKILRNKQQSKRISERIKRAKDNLRKKEEHIIKYHEYIQKKFGEKKPWKQAFQRDLDTKRQVQYQKTEQQNSAKINEERMGPYALKMNIKREKEVLGRLRAEFSNYHQQAMRKMLEEQRQKVNRFRKESIERIRCEYRKLQRQKESLGKNKQQYEHLNQNLEFLLTVEEEHENSCIMIERAMILKQNQKILSYTFELETSTEIQTNLIPNLQAMLSETMENRTKLRDSLQKAEQTHSDFCAILESKITIFHKLSH